MLTLNKKQKNRLFAIIFILLGVGTAIAITMYALRQNISLFYTPSQVHAGVVPKEQLFRIGGLVVKGSVQHDPQTLTVSFMVSDTAQQVKIVYQGILPDLFREGQGIVAEGRLQQDGNFQATRVLAKHDENYMPPEVLYSIETARQQRDS